MKKEFVALSDIPGLQIKKGDTVVEGSQADINFAKHPDFKAMEYSYLEITRFNDNGTQKPPTFIRFKKPENNLI